MLPLEEGTDEPPEVAFLQMLEDPPEAPPEGGTEEPDPEPPVVDGVVDGVLVYE